jgi:phage host-nuclease inhibitor protein Gam
MKYGQNHDEVESFIENIKKLTPEQFRKHATAADAAADAADAYADAAAAAAWRLRYVLRRAAFALAIKHLIGQYGFTQEHYNLLTAVVSVIKEEVSPKVIISEPEVNPYFHLSRDDMMAILLATRTFRLEGE